MGQRIHFLTFQKDQNFVELFFFVVAVVVAFAEVWLFDSYSFHAEAGNSLTEVGDAAELFEDLLIN